MTRPPMHTSTWVIMILLTLLALPFDIYVYDFAFERRLPPLMAGLMLVLVCSQLAAAYGFSRVLEWFLRRSGKLDWLQLHLSTCLVLMFVAGGIIGLNLRQTQVGIKSVYGWPLRVYESASDGSVGIGRYPYYWDYWRLTLNIAATIVIFFIIGVVCERRYRKPSVENVEPERSTL